MKLLNWNIRGLSGNWAEKISLSRDYDVMALSESKLTKNRKDISINDFNHIRIDRENENRGGGMVTYIRKNLQYISISLDDIPEGLEYIACKIFKNTQVINLVSVYIPPEISFNYNELNKRFKACSHLKNLILTGDFNAHNALWSVKTSDNRGNQIVNLLPIYDLIIMNKLDMQTRTYVDSGEIRHSSPDITFSSSDISLSLSWCKLDTRGSDHLPINIEVIDSNLKFERSYKKIKHDKTDWEKFTSNVLNNFDFENSLNEENFLVEYNKFIDIHVFRFCRGCVTKGRKYK